MKRNILLLLIFSNTSLFSQQNDSVKAIEFNHEVSSFIVATKPSSSKYSFEYFVYVASVFSEKNNNNYCFTLGYILNSGELDYVEPNYFYNYNNEIIVIRINELLNQGLIKHLGLKKINSIERNKILCKLFCSEYGGFTYRSKGLTYCNNNGNTEKTLHENSDMIPFEKSIYASFPTGGTIELIDNWATKESEEKSSIELLKEFYTAYVATDFIAEKWLCKIDSLQQKYCSIKLRKDANEALKEGHDMLTNDYGIIVESLKTLTITKDSTKENTYIVSYITTNKDSDNSLVKQQATLFVTVIKEGGIYKIDSVR